MNNERKLSFVLPFGSCKVGGYVIEFNQLKHFLLVGVKKIKLNSRRSQNDSLLILNFLIAEENNTTRTLEQVHKRIGFTELHLPITLRQFEKSNQSGYSLPIL